MYLVHIYSKISRETTEGIKRVKRLQNSKQWGKTIGWGPIGLIIILQKQNKTFSIRASQGFLKTSLDLFLKKSIRNAIKLLILNSLNSLNLFTVFINLGNRYIHAHSKLTETKVTAALQVCMRCVSPTGITDFHRLPMCFFYEMVITGK